MNDILNVDADDVDNGMRVTFAFSMGDVVDVTVMGNKEYTRRGIIETCGVDKIGKVYWVLFQDTFKGEWCREGEMLHAEV